MNYLCQAASTEASARLGISGNRSNRTCEWLAFLDSDDEWRPEKLARQMAALDDDFGGAEALPHR